MAKELPFWEYVDGRYCFCDGVNIEMEVGGKTYRCYKYIKPSDKFGMNNKRPKNNNESKNNNEPLMSSFF